MRRTLAQIPSLFGRLLVPITIPSGTPIAILEIQRGSGHNQFEVYALVRDCPTVHGLPPKPATFIHQKWWSFLLGDPWKTLRNASVTLWVRYVQSVFIHHWGFLGQVSLWWIFGTRSAPPTTTHTYHYWPFADQLGSWCCTTEGMAGAGKSSLAWFRFLESNSWGVWHDIGTRINHQDVSAIFGGGMWVQH